MIIIAGRLHVAAESRAAYLAAVAGVAPLARRTTGCLDFVQAADPVDDTRINVFEQWESDEALHAFRSLPAEEVDHEVPDLLSADVRKYRIAAVEDP